MNLLHQETVWGSRDVKGSVIPSSSLSQRAPQGLPGLSLNVLPKWGLGCGWHFQGLEERKTKRVEFPHPLHKHPVRHGFPKKAGVLLPQEVLRLTRVLRVSAGVTGNTPRQDWSDSGATTTIHSPQKFHSRRTRKNHPAPFSSLLGLWDWNQLYRGEGRAAARSFQCPHGKEMCTAVLTQGCLTLLHGAFPSQLHLRAF